MGEFMFIDLPFFLFIVFAISVLIHIAMEFKYRSYFGKWGHQSHLACIRKLAKDKPVAGWTMLLSLFVMLSVLVCLTALKLGR